jgi:hypothetical protein
MNRRPQHSSLVLAGQALIAALAIVDGRSEFGPAPGSYDLSQLFAKADAVCLGQVDQRTEAVTRAEGAAKAVSRTVGLTVLRCYKGGVSAADTISYDTHVPAIHTADPYLPPGRDVVVFLKQTQPRMFTLAFPFFGVLADASLDTLTPMTGTGLEQLQRDIVASTKGAVDRRVLDGNLRVLHGFSSLSEEAQKLLRSYTENADPEVAMGAFAALVKLGSPSDLLALCQYVSASGGAAAASTQGYHNFSAIGTIRRQDDRGALECLARAPWHGLRLDALEALRRIGSPLSVPELMAHLDDADPTAQYLAVASLQEIVRRTDEICPSVAEFEQDKSRFIQSWKQWWFDKGRALYPESPKQ